MAEQKRRLVMDVVAPPPAPEPPAKKKKFDWSKLKRLQKLLPARRMAWVICTLVIIVIIIGGIDLYGRRSANPLPASVTKSAGFALYYPTPLPAGYNLRENSAKFENGYVFYTLQYGSKSVSVTEQAAPSNPPNLAQLAGFTSLNTLAGNAAAGTNFSGQPSAIIASNTTLITLTGQRGMPQDVVSQLAQNMRSLQ